MADEKDLTEKIDTAKDTAAKVATAGSKVVNSTMSLTEDVSKTVSSLNTASKNMDEMEDKIVDAEEAAAEATQNSYVSISDALKLVEEEDEQRKTYGAEYRKYLKTAVSAPFHIAKSTLMTTVGTVTDVTSSLGLTNGAKVGLGVAAITGIGAMIQGEGITDSVKKMVDSYKTLEKDGEVDLATTVKTIAGAANSDELVDMADSVDYSKYEDKWNALMNNETEFEEGVVEKEAPGGNEVEV